MADQKISALTAYTTPIDTDVLPIVDVTTGITKKVTVAKLGNSTVSDVTGSRAINGTVYQNTTGRQIFVLVTIYMPGAQTTVYGIEGKIGVANPPTLSVVRSAPRSDNSAGTVYAQIMFIVPNNYYYNVTPVTGTGTLNSWIEYTV